MNKYDKKLLEFVPNNGVIHELLSSPVRSTSFHFINILLDNIPWLMDNISVKGAYYLYMNEEEDKASLIHIDRNLNISQENVTEEVKHSANKKSFIYKENKYKFYRKIR